MAIETVSQVLTQYLLDEAFRERFDGDPQGTLAALDLTPAEARALLDGDGELLNLLNRVRGAAESPPAAPPETETSSEKHLFLPPITLYLRVDPHSDLVDDEVHIRYATSVYAAPPSPGEPVTAGGAPPLPGQTLRVQIQPHAICHDGQWRTTFPALVMPNEVSSPDMPTWVSVPEPPHGDPDIWIIGTGMVPVDQLTVEAERAVRRSRKVLVADTGVATLEWLQARCDDVVDVFDGLYTAGQERIHAYQRVADNVIAAAKEQGPVTFAIHGHPLVFSTPPFLVMEAARREGLTVRVLPGISATAQLLCDLAIDPGAHGIQMMEATDMLVRRRPLQPDMPALIWQIGNVETRLHSYRPSLPKRFERLVHYLSLYYPPNHEVVAAYARPHPLAQRTLIRTPLSKLPAHASKLHIGFTLYLPAVGTRPIYDQELADLIDDPAHLATITHS
jgi:hypothetical protein